MLQTVKSSVSFNLYFWVKNFLTISLCSSTLRQQRLTYTDRRRNDKDYFFYLNPFFLFYSCSYMGSFTFPPSQIQSLLRNNLMIFFSFSNQNLFGLFLFDQPFSERVQLFIQNREIILTSSNQINKTLSSYVFFF
jgi:hypothetical protein